MTTRRSWIRRVATFAIAAAVYPFTPACTNFQTVYAQVDAWITTGLDAFASVVQILQGAGVTIPGGPLVDFVPAVIRASLAAITQAIANYNNAPAAQKATLEGQIATAIQSALSVIQTWWTELAIPDASLAQIIEGIIGIVLSTLEGFANMLPKSANFSVLPVSSRAVKYTAKHRSLSQFKADVNHYLVGTPYAKYALK